MHDINLLNLMKLITNLKEQLSIEFLPNFTITTQSFTMFA